MCRLSRLIETDNRLFLLTERTMGDLLLVDWLQAYLERRLTALMQGGRRGLAAVGGHIDWCKWRSDRFRKTLEAYEVEGACKSTSRVQLLLE